MKALTSVDFRIRVNPVEFYLISLGLGRFASTGLFSHILPPQHFYLRAGNNPGTRHTRNQQMLKYLPLFEALPGLPDPLEWASTYPFGFILGTADYVERLPYDASLLTPLERAASIPQKYLLRLENYTPFPEPIPDRTRGTVAYFDASTGRPLLPTVMTPERLRQFWDLCELIDAMTFPDSQKNQRAIRNHPGFPVSQSTRAAHRGILRYRVKHGWFIVRRPPWRETFLKRFPDFKP